MNRPTARALNRIRVRAIHDANALEHIINTSGALITLDDKADAWQAVGSLTAAARALRIALARTSYSLEQVEKVRRA